MMGVKSSKLEVNFEFVSFLSLLTLSHFHTSGLSYFQTLPLLVVVSNNNSVASPHPAKTLDVRRTKEMKRTSAFILLLFSDQGKQLLATGRPPFPCSWPPSLATPTLATYPGHLPWPPFPTLATCTPDQQQRLRCSISASAQYRIQKTKSKLKREPRFPMFVLFLVTQQEGSKCLLCMSNRSNQLSIPL